MGPIFYGWWIVAVSFLVLFVHAGCAFYSFAVLRDVLEEELATSSAAISGAVSIYMLTLGLTAPLAGRLTDKYGPKNVVVVGGVFTSTALTLMLLPIFYAWVESWAEGRIRRPEHGRTEKKEKIEPRDSDAVPAEKEERRNRIRAFAFA